MKKKPAPAPAEVRPPVPTPPDVRARQIARGDHGIAIGSNARLVTDPAEVAREIARERAATLIHETKTEGRTPRPFRTNPHD